MDTQPARSEVGEGSLLSVIDWDQYHTTESEVGLEAHPCS
jgi:hypothetical protein